MSFLYSVQRAGLRTEKFTGKEEDTDVGLHYFGARYYSAYLGRWLSPDPPVVHGSAAGANYFQYAANAPYIAIDPDGNWVNVLIGAIVGSIVGSANEIIKRGGIRSIADAGWVILAGIRGGGIGAAAGSGNAWLAAAASTADQQVQMMYDSGGDMSILTQAEFHKQSAVVFGSSVGASYAGQGIGSLKGGMVFNAAASYGVGVATAAANQMVLTGRGLRGEDWERFLKDQAISSTVSFGGSLVGREIGTGLNGGGGENEISGAGGREEPNWNTEGVCASRVGEPTSSERKWDTEGTLSYLEEGGYGDRIEQLNKAGWQIVRFEHVRTEVVRGGFREVEWDGIWGSTDYNNKTIYIEDSLGNFEAAQTLVHESEHALFGAGEESAWYADQKFANLFGKAEARFLDDFGTAGTVVSFKKIDAWINGPDTPYRAQFDAAAGRATQTRQYFGQKWVPISTWPSGVLP